MASAGEVIYVDAGTYTGAVTVNKAVILKGANYGAPGSATRSSESIISNPSGTALTISTSGSTVDGFNILAGTAVSSSGVSAIIEHNKIAATATGINIAGTSSGYTVANNEITLSSHGSALAPTIGVSLTGVSGTTAATVSNNNIIGGYYGYFMYNVNSTPASSVTGGTITGAAQGIAAINGYAGYYPFVPSTVNISGITMSGFVGGTPQAGIYSFTGGSSNSATMNLNITGVNISGTGKLTADAAAMNFSDYSTATSILQNIVVSNSTISNNSNRGIAVRGPRATATVSANTINGNGFDAFGSPTVGYGVIALEGATLNLNNNFITNPSATSGVQAFALCAATIPAPQGAG